MKVAQINKELPKRKTFVCDICGYEQEVGALNPLVIHKTEGDYAVTAYSCRAHFTLQNGGIVYTPQLLRLKFEVENKAKEFRVVPKE